MIIVIIILESNLNLQTILTTKDNINYILINIEMII